MNLKFKGVSLSCFLCTCRCLRLIKVAAAAVSGEAAAGATGLGFLKDFFLDSKDL